MSTHADTSVDVKMGQVVRRLWPSLIPFKSQFIWGVVLIFASTAVESLIPWVTGKTVDVVTQPEKNMKEFATLITIFSGLIVIKSILEFYQAYVIQAAGAGVTHELRVELFRKIQSLYVEYFDKNPTGRLLTRVINDIKSLSELFTASISVVVFDGMVILGTMVAMFVIHWKLAALTLLTFPLVGFTIQFFGDRLARVYRLVRVRLAEINAFLGENVGAIATIQRLNAQPERYEKFEGIANRHMEAQIDSVQVFAMVVPITNVLNGIAIGTLIGVGGLWVIHGEISLGVLVAFLGYLRNLFQPVRDLVEKYNTFLSAKVSAERVVAILDEKSELILPTGNGAVQERKRLKDSSIEFENVNFRYPTRVAAAMENVSFKIPHGKSLAIVGPTGGGKSTIIRLLLRFYEPQSGRILFGGKDLKDWEKHDLRSHIGVVHQEIYLFQGTLRENLTLGREGYTDEYLKDQCERGQLWPLIASRGGLDAEVLEGGTNFSIGEKQLLSMVRIFVANTEVLVLDEATSSIDRVLERRLMDGMSEVMMGRTSIVIAHRLSTIQRCNEILVVDKGKISEMGTYRTLLKSNGLFAKFHEIYENT